MCVYWLYCSKNTKNEFSWISYAISDDPEVPHVQHHRKFLKEYVIYKEVYLGSDYLFYFGREARWQVDL